MSGGSYESGIPGCTPALSLAIASQTFGRQLLNIVSTDENWRRGSRIKKWRTLLQKELTTNQSGTLPVIAPRVARAIPECFPGYTLSLYKSPVVSPSMDTLTTQIGGQWFTEPSLFDVTQVYQTHFGWTRHEVGARFPIHVWPAVLSGMLNSVCTPTTVIIFMTDLV